MQKLQNFLKQPHIKLFLLLFGFGFLLMMIFNGRIVWRRLNGARDGVGQIVTIDQDEIVVRNRRQELTTIVITPGTKFSEPERFMEQLHPDDFIYVSGIELEKGKIEAKFIRIMPPPRK